ncbi:hypothetical protein A2933_01500 [Candidatus Nomurabacteria bacterium RIFCSPLOWO2_01_FULL_46_18]|uniref:Transcobalamin-like C-terminal domain-containing protein n=1 Tax=Candidatus Nomurabacteria bacterium RIFCSPLOWO2_01_FULL_46_18 TaxID=1801783 RepID=A0A1F6XCW2_9BACT|nr:MAG: hypothetical protein A2933_01500 [Candidatus Nomurabacteria bacterium RIFCSPLOWO2_01_FULL_46_18]
MKKELIKKIIFVSLILSVVFWQVSWAQEAPLQVLIADEGNVVLDKNVHLPEEGMLSVTDTQGNSQDINAKSVLAVLYALDEIDDTFTISDLVYYPSFSAFYLKCIVLSGEEKCNYWLYKVNDDAPSVGMDSFILSGGEKVEIYFDSGFFGGGEEDPEPEVVEDPPEEEEGSTGGGSGSRKRRKTPEPAPEEEVAQPVAALVPAVTTTTPPEPPAAQKIAKAEPAIEKVAEIPVSEPAPIELSAIATESGNSPKIPIIFAGLLAFLVLIFLGRRFLKNN